MKNSPTYRVKFRRRRELKTNYKKRLALLKSGKPRFVVRKSNNSVSVQVVEYRPSGDIVRASFSSNSLAGFGWSGHTGNTPAAYLAGFAGAKKALKTGIGEAVPDIGMASPIRGSRVFASIMGAVDAGLRIPAGGDKIFPSKDRIVGKHLGEETEKNFEETKSRIEKEFG